MLFPAARIRCFLHPGIAPRPVSFDMLLSGVCIACFALVRSRSRRRDIRLRVLFTAVRVCCFSHAKISHCRARSYLRCPAPYHVLRDRTWTIAYPRVCRPRKVFVRPTDAQVYFPRPTVKLSAPRRTLAALPLVNVTHKTSLRASTAPLRHG